VVHAGAVDVTVLGTAFEVTAREGNDTVVVRVRHGKVGVRVGELDTLVLTAGQEARWVRRTNVLERISTGPVERWADRIIQFNNAPLQQVVEELTAVYGARIELGSDNIAGCPLTASFGEENIDEIVRIIAGTFGLAVERTETNVYTLTGDGC
jgi:transmembrane sensor